jgi:hypothetical protein
VTNRIPKYRMDQHLSPLSWPADGQPAYPHNYGVALRAFETMVALDAVTHRAYGPHGNMRLVLTQTGLWVRSTACKNCGEAVWQDGIVPGRGIWLHKRRDAMGMFQIYCGPDDEATAEPGDLVAQAAAGERTAEHLVVTS